MYNFLIFDTVNLAYRLHDKQDKVIIKTAKGFIYKNLARKMIETIKELKQFYFADEVILLFDNYNSKILLQETFEKALHSKKEIKTTYKAQRLKETDEFYTTIDFVKYYFLIQDKSYHTVQIKKLEADDLVNACIKTIVKDKKALLITNDLDWAIHLSENIHYTPNSFHSPVTPEQFFEKYQFTPSKQKITLYKILFGDKSDNIEVTYPEIPLSIRKKMFESMSSIADLYFFDINKYPFLEEYKSYIKEKENILKMNEYILTPIDIDEKFFISHYTTGRDSKRMQQIIETALLEKKEKIQYKFGG